MEDSGLSRALQPVLRSWGRMWHRVPAFAHRYTQCAQPRSCLPAYAERAYTMSATRRLPTGIHGAQACSLRQTDDLTSNPNLGAAMTTHRQLRLVRIRIRRPQTSDLRSIG